MRHGCLGISKFQARAAWAYPGESLSSFNLFSANTRFLSARWTRIWRWRDLTRFGTVPYPCAGWTRKGVGDRQSTTGTFAIAPPHGPLERDVKVALQRRLKNLAMLKQAWRCFPSRVDLDGYHSRRARGSPICPNILQGPCQTNGYHIDGFRDVQGTRQPRAEMTADRSTTLPCGLWIMA